eukprot:6207015-Prymnesium_polylepis.1
MRRIRMRLAIWVGTTPGGDVERLLALACFSSLYPPRARYSLRSMAADSADDVSLPWPSLCVRWVYHAASTQ